MANEPARPSEPLTDVLGRTYSAELARPVVLGRARLRVAMVGQILEVR